ADEAGARPDPRDRCRSRQGVLHGPGRLRRRPRPPGPRRAPLRPAHPARLRLLGRPRDRDHGDGAGVGPELPDGGRGRPGGARRTGGAGRGRERGRGAGLGLVRLLQRPRRQRLGAPATSTPHL
ncbi:MAG: possible lyase, partial [uncultured Thermomicrobiales bacterium]